MARWHSDCVTFVKSAQTYIIMAVCMCMYKGRTPRGSGRIGAGLAWLFRAVGVYSEVVYRGFNICRPHLFVGPAAVKGNAPHMSTTFGAHLPLISESSTSSREGFFFWVFFWRGGGALGPRQRSRLFLALCRFRCACFLFAQCGLLCPEYRLAL